jgi:predicted MFS family arabinose efflux permease
VLGVLLSGSIAGIVLARALGGVLAGALGWREVYAAAAALSLAMAVAVALVVPVRPVRSRAPYGALLLGAVALLRSEPDLRRSCAYQASVFAAFSAVWTTLALLVTGPVYGLGTEAIGLLSLVGVGTMVCAPLAGRLADRRGPDLVNGLALLGALAAAAVLAGGAAGGTPGLVALALGALLLDVSMQSSMLANHTRVLALRADARSRLNTALMTCVYLAGAAGSWLGLRAFAAAGWSGVSGLAAALVALGLLVHVTSRARSRSRRHPRERARPRGSGSGPG